MVTTSMKNRWKFISGIAVICLAFTLSACNDKADSNEIADDVVTSDTDDSALESKEEEPAEDETPAGVTTPAECIVGDWLADNELFFKQIRELGSEITKVDGDIIVTFTADGQYITDYQDWTIDFLIGGMDGQFHRVGTDLGTYEAGDTHLSITETEMKSDITMSMMGQTMPFDPIPMELLDESYTCDGDEAVLNAYDDTHRLIRQ